MSQTFLPKWNWKGFFLRYSIFLIGLVAIYYFISSSNESNPSQTALEEVKSPTMAVSHEVVGKELHLRFELTDFELSFEHVNKEKMNNYGHIHLYVDGEKVMKIYENEYVYKDLEPGTHQIKVELAHNDHDSYGIEHSFDVTID